MRCSSTHRTDQASTSSGNHGTPGGTGTAWPRSAILLDDRFGLASDRVVLVDHARQCLARLELEVVLVLSVGRVDVGLSLDDQVDPVPLDLTDVLDQPAHGERAGAATPDGPDRRSDRGRSSLST